jgi:hypothetical protein
MTTSNVAMWVPPARNDYAPKRAFLNKEHRTRKNQVFDRCLEAARVRGGTDGTSPRLCSHSTIVERKKASRTATVTRLVQEKS